MSHPQTERRAQRAAIHGIGLFDLDLSRHAAIPHTIDGQNLHTELPQLRA